MFNFPFICFKIYFPLTVLTKKKFFYFLSFIFFLNCERKLIASCCSVAQSCPTLCDPMDYSTPGQRIPWAENPDGLQSMVAESDT